MKEIEELSSGIQRLKKNSEGQKKVIEALEKDRALLLERCRFLAQKLSEAYVVYEEAGKRILDFVDKETAPIKNQISELRAQTRGIPSMEQELKAHSSHLSKIHSGDEALKGRLLETEKALKRLDEMAAVSKSHIDRLNERETKEDAALESRLAELKGHMESQLKASQERLSIKIAESSEEVLHDSADSMRALSASQEELRKRLSETGLAVRQLKANTASLKKQLQSAGFSRAEMEKRLSGHQASLKALGSAMARAERRLEGIGLEDERLEKRLSEARKHAEGMVSQSSGQLKSYVDAHQKRQDAALENRLKAVTELERRISEVRKSVEESAGSRMLQLKAHVAAGHKRQAELLEGRLRLAHDDFTARISKMDERLAAEKQAISSRIEAQNSAFGKLAKEQHMRFESAKAEIEKRIASARSSLQETLSSEAARLREGIDSHQKRQDGMLKARLESISQGFGSRVDKLEERLSGQGKQLDGIGPLISEKVRESERRAHLARSGLEKRLSLHQASIKGIGSAVRKIEKRLDGISLEDEKLEKRLAVLKKGAEERISSEISGVNGLLESRISGLSDRIDGKIEESRKAFSLHEARLRKEMGELRKGVLSRDSALASKMEGHATHLRNLIKEQQDHISAVRSGLEGMVAGSRKDSEKVLHASMSGLRSQLELSQKRQAATLESRLKEIAAGERKISELRRRLSAEMEERFSSLKSRSDEQRRKQQESLEAVLGDVEERLSGHRDSIKSLDAAMRKAEARLEGMGLEDEKLEKRLSEARKAAEELIGSKTGQLKSLMDAQHKRQAELLEGKIEMVMQELDNKAESINERFADERAQSGKHVSNLEALLKQQHSNSASLKAELEKRLSAHSAATKELGSEMGRLARKVAGMGIEDEKLEKRLSEVRKHAEEVAESGAVRVRSYVDAHQKRQAELLEARLGAIAQGERKLSDFRRHAESEIASALGDVKSQADLRYKKQNEGLESRIKALSEDLEKRVSKLNESLGLRDGRILAEIEERSKGSLKGLLESRKRMETLLEESSRKLEGRMGSLQQSLEARISSLDGDFEARISQLHSHVASEKKAIGEMRAAVRKEMAGEEKAFIARINGLSEKTRVRMSELSGQIALEKKALLRERQKLSKNIRDTARTIARMDEFPKSLDNRLERSEAEAVERMRRLEASISAISDKAEESSEAVTKSMDSRFGRLEAQLRSQNKGISGSISSLSSYRLSSEKNISEIQAFIKKLSSSVSELSQYPGTSLKKQKDMEALMAETLKRVNAHQEYIKGLESAVEKVLGVIEGTSAGESKLENRISAAKQEFSQRLSQEGRVSRERMNETLSAQKETEKRVAALEGALKSFSERASRSEKAFSSQIQELMRRLSDTGKDLTKTRTGESEVREHADKAVRAAQESARLEISRLAAEMAEMRKHVEDWKEEQARLYELLREEE